MKATGIVRRIDDLGRVVIPKEIRRTMRIREGDPRGSGSASGCWIWQNGAGGVVHPDEWHPFHRRYSRGV